MKIILHAKCRDHREKDRFACAGILPEETDFLAQAFGVLLINTEFACAEFDFAEIDTLILTIDQEVDLDAALWGILGHIGRKTGDYIRPKVG